MRSATTALVVLGSLGLVGATLLARCAGTTRRSSIVPEARAPEGVEGTDEDPLESLAPPRSPSPPEDRPALDAGGSDVVPPDRPAADERIPRPGNALLFRIVDGRTGEALSTFEVRLGQAHLRPLLDHEGRVRHDFPEGIVRFPGLIEGKAGESVQLAITARGYAELRVPDLFVAPGRELDLGTLRLERAPRITVRVLDELTGEPVPRARVSLLAPGSVPAPDERPPNPSALDPWSGRTDREGRVLLSSRPGERVTLSVRHAGHERFDAQLFLPLSEEHQETVHLRPTE